jgi:hypothetical protein
VGERRPTTCHGRNLHRCSNGCAGRRSGATIWPPQPEICKDEGRVGQHWADPDSGVRVQPVARSIAVGTTTGSRHTGRSAMKKILELICCVLHPIAVVLIWITVWFNKDLNTGQKVAWAIVSIIPLVPFVYVLTGNDFL